MSIASAYSAVVAGHLCLDIIPDLSASTAAGFAASFAPGRLTQVGGLSFSTGGPVSNVGLALHRLGIATHLMGKVGSDALGDIVLQLVRARDESLAQAMVVDSDAHTSYTIVINPPGIDRYFLHDPGANDTFGPEDIDYEALKSARLFHFGYPPLMRRMYADDGREVAELLRRAKQSGITTSLDMAMPDPGSAAGRANWPRILAVALPFVDVFAPSIEELLFMLRPDQLAELERRADDDILPLLTPELLSDVTAELLALGPAILCLKLGYRGLYLRTSSADRLANMGRACPDDVTVWAEREMWSPCFVVDLIGAAGSGDSTIAGFLAALLRGMSPQEAVTMAVAVGACNVEAADTLSSLRSWGETQARVQAGWPRRELRIDASGWEFDSTHRLWERFNL
ncbi:MAG: carbohydrate kinase family protein [Caldilineales bacterium]|nr:carbohydrate kinase family protein [Caldilineales bacterium]